MVKHAKGGREIPTPITLAVESYALDYLPTFNKRNTYIRGKGGSGFADPTFVEYDLDEEDFKWLATVNHDGQERISPEKLEMMLWKLDVMNADATDKVFSFQGSAVAERRSAQACATTDHLQKQDALQLLEECCPSRDTIRESVYEYWKKKRASLGRPLLRRLQAPTPLNNTDPYKVFRSRDRPNRPQTRRRRENNPDSLDKLTMIADNIKIAMQLFEMIVRRERKKRDLVYVTVEEQQLLQKQKHEVKSMQDALESEYLTSARSKSVKRPLGFEDLPEASPGTTNKLLEFKTKKGKKKKKLGEEPILNAVSMLAPPPLPVQDRLMPSWISSDHLSCALKDTVKGFGYLRIGRGGRIIVDRCNPFTMEMGSAEVEYVEPAYKVLSEMGPNPFAEWAGKLDLANKGYDNFVGRAQTAETVKDEKES
jgi:enhancer of polycomb-like protein